MSKYITFKTNPNEENFEKDLLKAIENKQILLHIIIEEKNWKFHLGAYTLSDWPQGTTHEDFYQYFERVYGLRGDWAGLYRFYHARILPIMDIDVRIQPKGRIPFGVIVIQHEEMNKKIVDFLQRNLGDEHKTLRPWSSIGIGTKNYLCKKLQDNYKDYVRHIDSIKNIVYVMTTITGKSDFLGGHSKLSELIDTAEHFANGDLVEPHLWGNILSMTNMKAFYREVSEELGIVSYPAGDIGDGHCYHGRKTGHGEFIWIRFIADCLPIKLVISA